MSTCVLAEWRKASQVALRPHWGLDQVSLLAFVGGLDQAGVGILEVRRGAELVDRKEL